MTQRKTQLSERQFREGLLREQGAILRGQKTISQLSDWLETIAVSGELLAEDRRQAVIAGTKFLLFSLRKGDPAHVETPSR